MSMLDEGARPECGRRIRGSAGFTANGGMRLSF